MPSITLFHWFDLKTTSEDWASQEYQTQFWNDFLKLLFFQEAERPEKEINFCSSGSLLLLPAMIRTGTDKNWVSAFNPSLPHRR